MAAIIPSTTLIIATYNWPQALELCLLSVLNQRVLPNQIIIADDGSGSPTANLINHFKTLFTIPLLHVWHEDNGFRKTIILNQAIQQAPSDYIIQIDGDIILHPKFINDHLNTAQKNFFVKGSRVILNERFSNNILANKNVKFNIFFSKNRNKLNGIRLPFLTPLLKGKPGKTNDIRGCNFAFWKTHFIAINGYNNDLNGWGHEDIEFAARLVNLGVNRKNIKFKAVCYHLYHQIFARDQENNNLLVYNQVVKNGLVKCTNGLVKL